MNIYLKVLLGTALLALIFRNKPKVFIITASILHIFVCGFRYKYMHGDLQKYSTEFLTIKDSDWFSQDIIREGRNTLFYALNKLVAVCSNDDFQALLFVIAFISTVSVAYLIYRYSKIPFISFWVWSCFGYYMFSFYSIKQTLAMAFVMLASIGIFENSFIVFLLFTVIAGFIHFPAFVFIPAYFMCKLRKAQHIVFAYVSLFILIFIFRNQIVEMLVDLYYDSDKYTIATGGSIGGKALMMIALLIAGYLMCGFSDRNFRIVFILISLASILQLFSIYDNVFTRLADYYFQFIILFAPSLLSQVHKKGVMPPLFFDKSSRKVILIVFAALALLFYTSTSLKVNPRVKQSDNLLNYHFMWEEGLSDTY